MCRLLAQITSQPKTMEESMLSCPMSLRWLSLSGRQPEAPEVRGEHRDGSGFGWVTGEGKIQTEKRGPSNVWDESFAEVVKATSSKLFIAHNRLASDGLDKGVQGVHPFLGMIGGTPVALCHNGSVSDFMAEAQDKGLSDTEIFLNEICSEVKELSLEALRSYLSSAAERLNYTSLTSFLLTPNSLFGWRIFKEGQAEWYEKYYTLYSKREPGQIVIASEPLDQSNVWELLKNRSVFEVALKGDKLEMRSLDLD